MVDDRVPRPVEPCREVRLRDGEAYRVRDALAERASRRLDAGREMALRMTGRAAAELAKAADFLDRQVVAGQVQERVQEHRAVARRQDEAIAIGPVRIPRVVAEEACPQHVRHRRRSHRQPRVTGVRALHGVHSEEADRVDAEVIEAGFLHGGLLTGIRHVPCRRELSITSASGAAACESQDTPQGKAPMIGVSRPL